MEVLHVEAIAESLEVTGDRVQAKLKNAEPMDFFSTTYGLEITVDLPLIVFEKPDS